MSDSCSPTVSHWRSSDNFRRGDKSSRGFCGFVFLTFSLAFTGWRFALAAKSSFTGLGVNAGAGRATFPAAIDAEPAGDSAVLVATAMGNTGQPARHNRRRAVQKKIKSPEVVLNLFVSASSSL